MQDNHATRPATVPWPPVLIGAVLVIGVVLGRRYPLAWPGLDDLPARIIGYGLGAAGLALMAWGFLTLQRAGTTIMPNKRVDRLVTEGAFGFRRNPIYMGEVLVFLGLAELTHNVWFAILTPLFALAVYALAIRPEERHLETRFGQAYLDYKERTRRWF
ncbi:MAG: isoprenylcysteine carboxylmethyltransferase family protein [Hyphomonadaceae bacterium]|jgi:protein-S-isoprenylcysteine O-methyltransferase Ste14|nr:isoprenylcysteine carboxylmethyltransferase family protein [Hyphomonadaceae bacterium]